MKIGLAFLAVLVLAGAAHPGASPPQQSASAERYIKQCEAEWAEAEVTGEAAPLERFVADDFIGVEPDGSFYRKPQAVSEAREAKGEFISNKLNAVDIRFYGDTAVAQGSETWERKTGASRRGSYVWTDTWVRRNGNWQVVAAEDIAVPEARAK